MSLVFYLLYYIAVYPPTGTPAPPGPHPAGGAITVQVSFLKVNVAGLPFRSVKVPF